MGLLKRIIRQTSNKFLAGIGARRNSDRLMINQPNFATTTDSLASQTAVAMISASKGRPRRKSGARKSHKKSSREAALLLAAKNHLPPVQFHYVSGKTAQLSQNQSVARRTQSFCQALVFSNRIILPNERVYIRVVEIEKGWSGTIRFGFTSVDPATLRYKMPKHVCPDMTNAGHTWARALADDVVRKNSVIHFSYDKNGFIHYGINNQDCGIFCANVNTSQHLWFVVDVYGLTKAVELIDPRAHHTSLRSGEADMSAFTDELSSDADRNTIFKSTSAMLEGRRRSNIRASFRKRLDATMGLDSHWRRRNHDLAELKGPFEFASNRLRLTNEYLPNIHSSLFPIAQQNIYSPMPVSTANDRPAPPIREAQHDYCQVINNANADSHQQHYTVNTDAYANSDYRRLPQMHQIAPMTTGNSNPSADYSLMSAGTSSASNSSSVSSDLRGVRVANDEHDICQQLEGLQLAGGEIVGRHHQNSASKTLSKSTTAINNNGMPVAATRKRLQQNNSSKSSNFKRSPDKADSSIHSGTNKASNHTTTHSKARASNSQASVKASKTKNQKSTSSRDNSNNNNSPPPAKDCPICFERPINCVLYQCGHMCTCYECGVKQWRTQSRTCPICRTIIKDVIKTYMS